MVCIPNCEYGDGRTHRLGLSCMVAVVIFVLCYLSGTAHAQGTIKGGGIQNFPASSYSMWAMLNLYAEKRTALQYEASNTTESIGALGKGLDFATSDSPSPGGLIDKLSLVQFPVYMGALIPVVNVKGATHDLRLNADVLARIYKGDITSWDDPAIKNLNKGLPISGAIRPLVKSMEASDTDEIWAYLSKASPIWAKYSREKAAWPGHVVAKPAQDLGKAIRETQGSIGFLAQNPASLKEPLVAAKLLNKAGNFVDANPRSISAAAQSSSFADDASDFLDQPGDDAWPIAYAGWVVIPKRPIDLTRARRVLNFFFNTMKENNILANDGLVALPDRGRMKALQRFKEVTGVDGAPLTYMVF